MFKLLIEKIISAVVDNVAKQSLLEAQALTLTDSLQGCLFNQCQTQVATPPAL